MMLAAVTAVALSQTATFPSTETRHESPRNMLAEIRVGSYYPWIDRPLDCLPSGHAADPANPQPACPYESSFGGGSMILVELELERQLFQAFGSAAVGASIGYAEKYGHAVAMGTTTSEATGLRILPMKVLGSYRFDYAAIRWRIPLVPYVKAGFEVVYWWATKGKSGDVSDGIGGNGWSYGLYGAAGIAFLLDVLDPRLARDFDTGMGVNHTYLFAEFDISEINQFGAKQPDGVTASGLDFSSRYAMFGVAFEF